MTYTHCTKCVLQTNLPRIRMIYFFRTGMNSTFTWAMLNKSVSALPITWNFKKTFHCYKSLGKIIDCVWPAPRILYQWNSFFEILYFGKYWNWFIWHSPRASRVHSGSENIYHSNCRKICLKYKFCTMSILYLGN